MLKKLAATTALSLTLIGGGAFAQAADENTTEQVAPPPVAENPATETGTMDGTATAPAATETTMDNAMGDEHGMPVDMASVTADELIGIEVRNADGEKLGDITDAMLAEDGAVGGVAVSFGGFLGFGENTVELMPDEIQLMRDEGDTLYAVTSLQPDDLKNRPEIKDD